VVSRPDDWLPAMAFPLARLSGSRRHRLGWGLLFAQVERYIRV
jgi:hypothetical protein